MQGINLTILMGRLGSSPQLYATKDGRPYTGLNLATHRFNHKWDNETGESNEITDWHYVRVWGTQAETCARYLSKGQAVLIEGYLSQYSIVKEDGEKERRTGITATRVEFLPRSMNSNAVPETGS